MNHQKILLSNQCKRNILHKKFYLQIFLLILLGIGWFAYKLLAPTDWLIGAWQCPFKAITGVACPGCGTTRGFYAIIMHHDVGEAIVRYNAFSAIEIPLMLLVTIMLITDFVLQKHWLYDISIKVDTALKRKRVLIPIILLIAANWGWNIWKGL